MTEDISKKTIMVLVVLTIIVSALGTLTVLDSVSKADFEQSEPAIVDEATDQANGFVTLRISEPMEATGNVVLRLVN